MADFSVPDSPPGATTLPDAERGAQAFHTSTAMDAVSLWNDGNNAFLRAMDPFNAHFDSMRPEQTARALLLTQAWNNLYCALSLAIRGHYGPAINLLRLPVENWMACRYLRWFPEDHNRFIQKQPSDPDTPTFNEMQTKVESKEGGPPDEQTRAWMKQLHKGSHVDRISLGLLIVPRRDGSSTFALGPQRRLGGFVLCTFGASASIALLLSTVDRLRNDLGEPPLQGGSEYVLRVLEWQRSLDKATLETAMGPVD